MFSSLISVNMGPVLQANATQLLPILLPQQPLQINISLALLRPLVIPATFPTCPVPAFTIIPTSRGIPQFHPNLSAVESVAGSSHVVLMRHILFHLHPSFPRPTLRFHHHLPNVVNYPHHHLLEATPSSITATCPRHLPGPLPEVSKFRPTLPPPLPQLGPLQLPLKFDAVEFVRMWTAGHLVVPLGVMSCCNFNALVQFFIGIKITSTTHLTSCCITTISTITIIVKAYLRVT